LKTLSEISPPLKEPFKSFWGKPYRCYICEARFAQKSSLKRHIESVHEGKKPFQCSICPENFARKEHLKIHTASIHDLKEQNKMSACNSNFSQNEGENSKYATTTPSTIGLQNFVSCIGTTETVTFICLVKSDA
jgi:uncharacterized Zn-finger protein